MDSKNKIDPVKLQSNVILNNENILKMINSMYSDISKDTTTNITNIQADINNLYELFLKGLLNRYEINALVGNPIYNYTFTFSPSGIGIPRIYHQRYLPILFGPHQGIVPSTSIGKVFNKNNYNKLSYWSGISSVEDVFNMKGYCVSTVLWNSLQVLGLLYEPKAQISSAGEADDDGEYFLDGDPPDDLTPDLPDNQKVEKPKKKYRLPQVPGTFPLPPIPREVLFKKTKPKYFAKPPGLYNYSPQALEYFSAYDSMNNLGNEACTLSYCQNLTLVGRTDRLFHEIYGPRWMTKVTKKQIKAARQRQAIVKRKAKQKFYTDKNAIKLLEEYNMYNFKFYSTAKVKTSTTFAISQDQPIYDPNANGGKNTLKLYNVFENNYKDFQSMAIKTALEFIGQIVFGNLDQAQGTQGLNIYYNNLMPRFKFNQLHIQAKLNHLYSVLEKTFDDDNDNDVYKYLGKRLKVGKITPITKLTTLRNFQRQLNVTSQCQFLAKQVLSANNEIYKLSVRVRRLERKNPNINWKDPNFQDRFNKNQNNFMKNFLKNPKSAIVNLVLGSSAVFVAATALGIASDALVKINNFQSDRDEVRLYVEWFKKYKEYFENFINVQLKWNDKFKADIASLNEGFDQLTQLVNNNEAEIEQHYLQLQKLFTSVGQIELFLKEHWPDYTDQITGSLTALKEYIEQLVQETEASLSQTIESNSQEIETLKGLTTENKTSIGVNSQKIESLENRIDSIKIPPALDLTELNQAVDKNTSVNSNQNEVITFLYNEIRKLQATIGNPVLPPPKPDDPEVPDIPERPTPEDKTTYTFFKGESKMFAFYKDALSFVSEMNLVLDQDYIVIQDEYYLRSGRNESDQVEYKQDSTMIYRQNLPNITYNPGSYSPNTRFINTPYCNVASKTWNLGFKQAANWTNRDASILPIRRSDGYCYGAYNVSYTAGVSSGGGMEALQFDDYGNASRWDVINYTSVSWDYSPGTCYLANYSMSSNSYSPSTFYLNNNVTQQPLQCKPKCFTMTIILFLRFIKRVMASITVNRFFCEGETKMFYSQSAYNKFIARFNLQENTDYRVITSQNECLAIGSLSNAGSTVGSDQLTLASANLPSFNVPSTSVNITLPRKDWTVELKNMINGSSSTYSLVSLDSGNNGNESQNVTFYQDYNSTNQTVYIPQYWSTIGSGSTFRTTTMTWNYGGESASVTIPTYTYRGSNTPINLTTKKTYFIVIEFLKDCNREVSVTTFVK